MPPIPAALSQLQKPTDLIGETAALLIELIKSFTTSYITPQTLVDFLDNVKDLLAHSHVSLPQAMSSRCDLIRQKISQLESQGLFFSSIF